MIERTTIDGVTIVSVNDSSQQSRNAIKSQVKKAAEAVRNKPKKEKKSAMRHEADFYPTPQPLCSAIVQTVSRILPYDPEVLIEPSAGMGPFVRELRGEFPLKDIIAVDIDGGFATACTESGATEFVVSDWVEYVTKKQAGVKALVIGNPPFSLAQEHIFAALSSLKQGSWVVQLLRMSFFGSQKRIDFWARRDLKHLIPLSKRPKFKKKGSDNSEYGIYVWEVGFNGNATILPHIMF